MTSLQSLGESQNAKIVLLPGDLQEAVKGLFSGAAPPLGCQACGMGAARRRPVDSLLSPLGSRSRKTWTSRPKSR